MRIRERHYSRLIVASLPPPSFHEDNRREKRVYLIVLEIRSKAENRIQNATRKVKYVKTKKEKRENKKNSQMDSYCVMYTCEYDSVKWQMQSKMLNVVSWKEPDEDLQG